MNELHEIFKKTGKRETAWVMLAWLFGAISYVLATQPDAGVRLVDACILPVMTFTAAVFAGQVYQNVTAAKTQKNAPGGFPPDPHGG